VAPRAPGWGAAWEGSLEAGLSMAIGVVLGYYADRWLGTEPVFLFVFLVVGSIAAFRRLLRIGVPKDTASSETDSEGGEDDRGSQERE
jgi:F0F1-type ATP synthase assembly protein I